MILKCYFFYILSNQLVQATPAGTLPIPSILWDSLTNRPTPNQQLRSQRSPCQSNNPCKNNDPGFMNTVNTNYMPINVETIAQTTYQTDEKETTTQQNDDENGSSSKQKTTPKADPSTVPKPQDEIATEEEEEEEEEEEKKQNTTPSQQETEGTAPSPLSSSKSSILSPSPSSQSSVFSSIAPSPSSIQSIQSKKITNPNSRDWNLHKPKKCTTRDIVADAQRFSNIGFDSVPMYKIGQCISKVNNIFYKLTT